MEGPQSRAAEDSFDAKHATSNVTVDQMDILQRASKAKIRGLKTILLGLAIAGALFGYLHIMYNADPRDHRFLFKSIGRPLERMLDKTDSVLSKRYFSKHVSGVAFFALFLAAGTLCLSGLGELLISLRKREKAAPGGLAPIRGPAFVALGLLIFFVGSTLRRLQPEARSTNEQILLRDMDMLWIPFGVGFTLGGTLLLLLSVMQRAFLRGNIKATGLVTGRRAGTSNNP